SALGQKQTLKRLRSMSAIPPKADIGTQSRNVRFVPKADSCTATNYAQWELIRHALLGVELSWTSPIERNVFARISRPLELKAERIHRIHDRFAPGYELSGSGLRTGRIHELRIFSR